MKHPVQRWLSECRAVFGKDLLIEAHSGEVLVTSAFFAVLVVILASLTFYGGPQAGRVVAAGALWLSVAFAAILSLSKTWQREREESALEALLIAPLYRSAIFAGKFLSVLTFLLVVEVVVVPVTALFFALDLMQVGLGLVALALATTPGLAASGTLFGAMTVRTNAKDLLLAVVLFPLLSPVLLAAVVATRELLNGASISDLADYLLILGIFDVVFCSGGLALFGPLMER